MNYDDREPPTKNYSLYRYVNGGVPDPEDDTNDLFDDAINGVDLDAQTNLNALLDELIAHYQRDEDRKFPDPRP